MTRSAFVFFAALLVFLTISGLDAVPQNRQGVLQAFLPLKSSKPMQQRKLVAGAPELFVSLQSELILSQEPYIQETINDEANVLNSLKTTSDAACAGFVSTGTDALMTLAGLSFANCVANIDDEMFAGLFPAQDSATRQQYAQASLLSSIRDVNILTDPATVQARIQEKLGSYVFIEGMSAIGDVSADLRAMLQACFSNSRALLKQSLQTASAQAVTVCAK